MIDRLVCVREMERRFLAYSTLYVEEALLDCDYASSKA